MSTVCRIMVIYRCKLLPGRGFANPGPRGKKKSYYNLPVFALNLNWRPTPLSLAMLSIAFSEISCSTVVTEGLSKLFWVSASSFLSRSPEEHRPQLLIYLEENVRPMRTGIPAKTQHKATPPRQNNFYPRIENNSVPGKSTHLDQVPSEDSEDRSLRGDRIRNYFGASVETGTRRSRGTSGDG